MAGVSKHYMLAVGDMKHFDKKIVQPLSDAVVRIWSRNFSFTDCMAMRTALVPPNTPWRKALMLLWTQVKNQQHNRKPPQGWVLTEYLVRKGYGQKGKDSFKNMATCYRAFRAPKNKKETFAWDAMEATGPPVLYNAPVANNRPIPRATTAVGADVVSVTGRLRARVLPAQYAQYAYLTGTAGGRFGTATLTANDLDNEFAAPEVVPDDAI